MYVHHMYTPGGGGGGYSPHLMVGGCGLKTNIGGKGVIIYSKKGGVRELE